MDIIKQNLRVYIPVSIVLAVTILLGGLFLYNTLSTKNPVDPQIQTQEEVKKYVGEIGKLMDLPVNETPTVATIIDITKLADQSFFKRGKNGDKVLLYPNNQKAILYDPGAKRIIEVGPFNPGTATASASAQDIAKVVLRNGTKLGNLAAKIEEKLKKEIPGIEISLKENAATNIVKKTTVSLLSDSKKAQAESIAKSLNVSLSGLASGEAKPTDADIVVIIGTDNQ